MAEWMVWLMMAGLLVILELFIGTFYLLMIAIGLASGGLAALTGFSLSQQLLVAAFIGVLATYTLHRTKFGTPKKKDPARDVNVNLDIGQQITVKEWNEVEASAHPTARVMYRGAWWDVELAAGTLARPGNYVITEIRGSRLIVSDINSNHN